MLLIVYAIHTQEYINSATGEVVVGVTPDNVMYGDAVQSTTAAQPYTTDSTASQFATIINNQKKIMAEMVTLSQCVRELFTRVGDLHQQLNKIPIAHAEPTEIAYVKIRDEPELKAFEENIKCSLSKSEPAQRSTLPERH